MRKRICGVYRIVNKIDGKVYYGSSTRLGDRIPQHKTLLRANLHPIESLQKSFNEIGEENFSFEVVEVVSKESLLEREQWYIDHSQSLDPNHGYNTKPKTDNSVQAEVTKKRISEKRKGRYQTDPVFKALLDSQIKHCQSFPKSLRENILYQYDLEGNFIAEHYNAAIAERASGASGNHIRSCCDGARKVCGGFRWSYEKVDKLPPLKKKRKPTQWVAVNQYTSDGEFLKRYESITAAAESFTPRFNVAFIVACCKGKCERAYGYKWLYA